VPPGTTSFYYRTRKALMHGVAARMTEIDMADLKRLVELADEEATGFFTGASGLAMMVSLAGQEPWLTRTKARFELALQAGRDPELAAVMQQSAPLLDDLVRRAVEHWQPDGAAADRTLLDEQADGVERVIEGIMLGYCRGGVTPAPDAEYIERLIRAVILGLGALRDRSPN